MAKALRFTETTRRDPFRNFNFIIEFNGVEVAACRKMSAIDATVNVCKFRPGNNLHSNDEHSPGRVEYPPVTFESGKTNDKTFQDWANMLISHEFRTGRLPDPDFRKDIDIKVLDVNGSPALQYKLFKAFVSKYTAMSDLAGEGNDVIIETLEVTHEGFERIEGTAA